MKSDKVSVHARVHVITYVKTATLMLDCDGDVN